MTNTPIDWTKPIETVPCERNPLPVPCEYVEGEGVRIMGCWIDADGHHEGDDWEWSVNKETGRFGTLDGSVRNVIAQPDPIKAANELLTSKGYSVGEPDSLEADREFVAGMHDACDEASMAKFFRDGRWDDDVKATMAYLRANKERI